MKKTILKKLPTVDNNAPKPKRGRPRKNIVKSEDVAKLATVAQNEQMEEINMPEIQKNKDYFKELKQQEIEKVKNEANSTSLEFLQGIVKDISNIQKVQERLKLTQVRYKTKYMELEHYKKSSRAYTTKLLNIISELSAKLVEYAPESEVIQIAEQITEIKKMGGNL